MPILRPYVLRSVRLLGVYYNYHTSHIPTFFLFAGNNSHNTSEISLRKHSETFPTQYGLHTPVLEIGILMCQAEKIHWHWCFDTHVNGLTNVLTLTREWDFTSNTCTHKGLINLLVQILLLQVIKILLGLFFVTCAVHRPHFKPG